jgi:hypothetical protein
MVDFCNLRGYILQNLLDEVWPKVRARDWRKNPRGTDV